MKYHYLTDDSEKSLAPFFSKTVLSACFIGVVIISISLIICWPRQPLSEFVGENKIPMVFFIIFAATLIVNSYINLCCGCGELIRRGLYIIKYPTDMATFEKENDFFTYGLIAFSLPTHLLYPHRLRKGYRASVDEGTSPSCDSLPEVRTKLGWQFWLGLPSDPSLAHTHRFIPPRAAHISFFGHPRSLRLGIGFK